MRLLPSVGSLVLSLAACATICQANTGYPVATGWGWDDFNTSTLNPAPPTFLTALPSWFDDALVSSVSIPGSYSRSFANPAQWTFTFADTPVPTSDFIIYNYLAWVVNNDGYNLPDGTAAYTYTAVTGDVGGADFTLVYQPGFFDPGGPSNPINSLADVDFFQIVEATTTYIDESTGQVTSPSTVYFVDNGFDVSTPFYNTSGGAWGYVYSPVHGNVQIFMDDTPFRTEAQGPDGSGQNDSPPDILSITWEAQTFLAVDMGADATTENNVQLYGGVEWGFTYDTSDTPEPSTLTLAGIGLALLIAGSSRLGTRACAK